MTLFQCNVNAEMDGPCLYFQVSLVILYVSRCSGSIAFPCLSLCVYLLLLLILFVLFSGIVAFPGCTHRGSYMRVHVLLNLLNELGKRDKCEAC